MVNYDVNIKCGTVFKCEPMDISISDPKIFMKLG